MSPCRLWPGLLAALAFLCPPTSSCGLSTHVEIGHRALEFLHLPEGHVDYKKLLLEHQDAYQAGTVFPDSFYPGFCRGGKYHDVSESTHWTPFLNASVHYIRENYPLPWDKDTEKLVAFLFGITSHMVADVSWHSLGIEQGFLRTMGAMDFHGSYSEAHPAGDFGTVGLRLRLPLGWQHVTWNAPIPVLWTCFYVCPVAVPAASVLLCS